MTIQWLPPDVLVHICDMLARSDPLCSTPLTGIIGTCRDINQTLSSSAVETILMRHREVHIIARTLCRKIGIESSVLASGTGLTISFVRIGGNEWATLMDVIWSGALKRLESIKMIMCYLSDENMVTLAHACQRGALPNVLSLDLDWNAIGGIDATAVADVCTTLPLLTTLYLGGNCLDDEGIGILLLACRALRFLERLHIDANYIGDAGIKSISDTGTTVASLRSLYLNRNSIGIGGIRSFVSNCVLGALPLLEILRLDDNRFGDDGVIVLAKGFLDGAIPRLVELHLSHPRRADDGLQALAYVSTRGALSHLRRLSYVNGTGDVGFNRLSAAVCDGALPCLEELYLGRDISDHSLAAYGTGKRFPRLHKLQLNGKDIPWARAGEIRPLE
jgi:hypothetical protein